MKQWVYCYILSFCMSLALACNQPTESIDNARLKLTMIDVSVAQAYIKIEVDNPNPEETIVLQRNGKTVMSFSSRKDTVFSDSSLTENSNYSYRLFSIHGGKIISESPGLNVTTLLPTSHEIEWKEYRFGDAYIPSQFRDVLVLRDNDIWACGEIYFADSLGGYNEYVYGAAHWDGNKWQFYKVMMHPYPTLPKKPVEVISLANINNTVFGLGYGGLVRFYDNYWEEVVQFIKRGYTSYFDQMMKMWALDESLIYCVGEAGSIYHVSDYLPTKIRGDAEPYLTSVSDVWGTTDPFTNKLTVYCALLNSQVPNAGKIIKITDKDKISEIPVNAAASIATVWTNKGFPLFIGGGLSFYENSSGKWKPVVLDRSVYLSRIRGTALNDIFAVGASNILAHYNGKSWKLYPEFNNSVYSSIDMKGNTIAVSGWTGNQGVILISKRP